MRKALAWFGGALGVAALWRFLRPQPRVGESVFEPGPDPAAELRARLDEARAAADDRDEFDAAEGQPVDQVEQQERPLSLEERRRAIHEKAQQALGEMQEPDE